MEIETTRDLRGLLRGFVNGEKKEASFRAVAGHLSGLIYHAAYRQSGDVTVAEEVVQNVLVQVSRKAGKLMKHPEILGWVHEATRLEVLQMRRALVRRKKREETAMKNMNVEQSSEPHLLADLDESLRCLSSSERELVLMRFFEGRTFPAIAGVTGRSETAEKKRLKRALEKMAGWFGKKGVTLSVAGLTTVLSTEMGKAAPEGVVFVAGSGKVVTAGVGSGKLAVGVSLLVAAGMAVPISAEWREVRELEGRIAKFGEAGVAVSDREVSGYSSASRSKRLGVVLCEPTMEEMNLPVSELAWRYGRAEKVLDELTMNRIELVFEYLDWEELEEFGLALESDFPIGFLNYLTKVMKPLDKLEFLMKIKAPGRMLAYGFADVGSLQEAAKWLFEKEESGTLISKSVRRDYRNHLWEMLYLLLSKENLGEGRSPTAEHLELVERGLAMVPIKFRPHFEKLKEEMIGENGEGGKQ